MCMNGVGIGLLIIPVRHKLILSDLMIQYKEDFVWYVAAPLTRKPITADPHIGAVLVQNTRSLFWDFALLSLNN